MPGAIEKITDPLLILYRGALAGEHKSTATIEHYIGATLDYMEWAQGTGYPTEVEQLTKIHVLGWLGSLWERTKAGTYSESSVRNRFVGFRCYVRWLIRNELVPAGYKDPFSGIPLPKAPETFKQLVEDDEVSAMLTFLEKQKRYRDVALVSLLYDTGMRAEEALTLKWTDFRDQSYKRAILGKDPDRRTKGQTLREVVIGNDTATRLARLKRQQGEGEFVFPSRLGGSMNTRSGHKLINTIARNAGIQRTVGIHVFRHSWACNMLNAGVTP